MTHTLDEQNVKLKQLIGLISPLEVEPLEEMDMRDDLAIDSMSMIRLILEVEEMLGRSIFHVDNINQLILVKDLLRICADFDGQDAIVEGEAAV